MGEYGKRRGGREGWRQSKQKRKEEEEEEVY